jgi:hypothetical protein
VNRPALTLATVLAFTGCRGDEVPEENPDCAWDGMFGETGDVFDGPPLEMGDFEGKDFVAWEDGQALGATVGPQGQVMLMPFIRVVEGAAGYEEGEERCLSVYLSYVLADDASADPELQGEAANSYVFRAMNGDWVAGPLWAPLYRAWVDDSYRVELTVRDTEWASQTAMTFEISGGPIP